MTTVDLFTDGAIDDRTRKLVWRRLGSHSVSQIAEETGLSREQVFRVKQQLFEEIDVLSIEEQVTKALVSMQELADQALEKIGGISDERNWSGAVNAAVNAQEKILKQLRALKKEDSSKVESLNALRVRELLRLMSRVVNAGVAEIAEEHGLDEAALLETFTMHLEIEARNMDTEERP